MQLKIADVEVQTSKLAVDLPLLLAQVSTLRTNIASFNNTLRALNLQQVTAQVNTLTENIRFADAQASLVQSSVEVSRQQALSLQAQVTDTKQRVAQYNESVWSSLQNWAAGFRQGSILQLSEFNASIQALKTERRTMGEHVCLPALR